MNKQYIIIGCLVLAIYAPTTLGQKTEIDLRLYEKRLISRHGQDGILQKIFDLIEAPSRYYVELEAGNGHYQSTTKYFKKKYGWKGLLLDRTYENPALNLHKESVTPENVCMILKKYNVPHEFDLMIINGGMEFYIWKALSASYKPRVVVITFNQDFNYDEDVVKPYDSSHDDQSASASILALAILGRYLEYSLVYQESTAHNLFFIHDDALIENRVIFKHTNDASKLYTGTPKAIKSANFTSSLLLLSHL